MCAREFRLTFFFSSFAGLMAGSRRYLSRTSKIKPRSSKLLIHIYTFNTNLWRTFAMGVFGDGALCITLPPIHTHIAPAKVSIRKNLKTASNIVKKVTYNLNWTSVWTVVRVKLSSLTLHLLVVFF